MNKAHGVISNQSRADFLPRLKNVTNRITNISGMNVPPNKSIVVIERAISFMKSVAFDGATLLNPTVSGVPTAP